MADYEVIGMRKQHLCQLKSGFDIFGITDVIIIKFNNMLFLSYFLYCVRV
jgi:hypothetical protein